MNRAQASKILEEIQRRKSTSASEVSSRVLAFAFPEQLQFIEDKARLKSALCTRRAGKSMACGIYALWTALQNPSSVIAYVALTRDSAKRIMWEPILKRIARKCGISPDCFNESELSITLPNRSKIYLVGADANDGLRERLLGQAFDLVVVDECASWRSDLRDLVYTILRPATADRRGTIAMIGTPGDVKNFFYDVTAGDETGWSRHSWNASQNPYVPWAEELAELLQKNPGIEETARFKQHYLGQWVIDETNLVYGGFSRERNVRELDLEDDAVYVLSLDPGFTDDTAIVVGRWRYQGSKTFEVVYAEKRPGLNVTEVGEWIGAVTKTFPISYFVADCASRQVVEELRDRWQYPFEAAEKSGKVEAISMLSGDMKMGNVLLDSASTAALQEELENLVWSERAKPKLVEDPGCANHCCDALLYAFRLSRHFQSTEPKKAPPRDSEEFEDEYLDRLLERRLEEERVAEEDEKYGY